MDNTTPKNADMDFIIEALAHFKENTPTPDQMKAFCDEKGYEYVSPELLQDFKVSSSLDEIFKSLYPKILEISKDLNYIPEVASKEELNKLLDENKAIENKIIDLISESEIPYYLLSAFEKRIPSQFSSAIERSFNAISNKCVAVYLELGKSSFGRPMTIKDAFDFEKTLQNK